MGIWSNIGNWSYKWVQNQDQFAKFITITYKGKEKYETFIGGFISIISFMLFLFNLIYLIAKLRDHKFSNTTTNISYIHDQNDIVNVSDFGLKVVFHTDMGVDTLLNPRYFSKIEFLQYNAYTDGYVSNVTTNSIEAVRWNETDYQPLLKYITHSSIGQQLCPKTMKGFQLQGNAISIPNMRYFALRIYFWNREKNESWATQEEFDEIFKNRTIVMFIENTYFDSEDYVDPIKKNLEAPIYDYMMNDKQKLFYIYISKNEAEIKDSYWPSFFGEDQQKFEYLSIDDSYNTIDNFDYEQDLILHISFILSNKKTTHSRSTLGYLDIFGIAGGLLSYLKIIFGMFVSPIVSKLYFNELVSKLYQYDRSEILNKSNQNQTTLNFHDTKQNLIDSAQKSMESRRFLKYSLMDSMGICKWLCYDKDKEGYEHTSNYKNKLLSRGIDKFNYEIDIVKVIKTLRNLELFWNTVLDEYQVRLFKYQYYQTLYLIKSEDEVPITIINKNDDKLSNEQRDEILNIIEPFKKKELSEIDEKLIKAILKPPNEDTLRDSESKELQQNEIDSEDPPRMTPCLTPKMSGENRSINISLSFGESEDV